MSETVHYVGKLTKIPMEGDLQNTAKRVLQNEGWCDESDADFLEQLEDRGYKKFLVHSGNIYKVEKTQLDPNDDIVKATKCPDGTIDFEVKYYNGGCSFNEAIDAALGKI